MPNHPELLAVIERMNHYLKRIDDIDAIARKTQPTREEHLHAKNLLVALKYEMLSEFNDLGSDSKDSTLPELFYLKPALSSARAILPKSNRSLSSWSGELYAARMDIEHLRDDLAESK